MSVERIKAYLEKYILPGIAGELKGPVNNPIKIVKEESLEPFVELNGGNTLLKILGYQLEDVDVKPFSRAMGTNVIIPDYALLPRRITAPAKPTSKKEYAAILDLKAPKENLDAYAEQILSYCKEANASFGLLFNGHSAQLFINTDIEQLAEFKEFEKQALAVGSNDTLQVAGILAVLSKQNLSTDHVKQARILAKKRAAAIIGDTENKQRQLIISKCLGVTRENPSDEVLIAIGLVDKELMALKPPPTLEELRVNWKPEPEKPLTPGKKAHQTKLKNLQAQQDLQNA